ncbi:MAG: pyruvate synthase subunit beta, partial [Desulfuromonadales bacterium]|nr:pyruvate synthase subunit beta [Desulfuromonadales bacterium]
MTVALGRAAVETGLFDLYEIEDGRMQLTGPSLQLLGKAALRPVREYLEIQTRFKALSDEQIAALQAQVDCRWAGYRDRFK